MINDRKHSSNKKISIGSAQFGLDYGVSNIKGKTCKQEVKKILNFAKHNNIVSIDTALSYGDSEKVLGSFGMSGFEVVTKIPSIENHRINIKDFINENFKRSLQRLGLSSIHGVLLHDANDLLSKNGATIFKSLEFLKHEGLVKKIGISSYNPEVVEKIINTFEIDLVQGPVNILDRRFISSGLIDRLSKSNIEFHSRSSFLQGLLLMKNSSLSRYFFKWEKLFNSFENILKELGVTPLEACVSYSFSINNVDRVIFGVENLLQLKEILKANCKEIDLRTFDQIKTDDPMLINPSLWPQ